MDRGGKQITHTLITADVRRALLSAERKGLIRHVTPKLPPLPTRKHSFGRIVDVSKMKFEIKRQAKLFTHYPGGRLPGKRGGNPKTFSPNEEYHRRRLRTLYAMRAARLRAKIAATPPRKIL